MALFATPDFGSSGNMALFLLIVWAVVLSLVAVGFVAGFRLLRDEAPKRMRYGVLLILVSGFVPLSCCLGPPHVIRLVYGNYPLGSYPDNKVKEGMTRGEVEAILGRPHERYQRADADSWYYWLDSFGIGWFAVQFGADGTVTDTYGN